MHSAILAVMSQVIIMEGAALKSKSETHLDERPAQRLHHRRHKEVLNPAHLMTMKPQLRRPHQTHLKPTPLLARICRR